MYLFYLLSSILLYSCLGQWPEPFDIKVFHSTTLTTIQSVDTYFQFAHTNVTHALTYVTFCPQTNDFTFNTLDNACHEASPRWKILMDRLVDKQDDYYRALFMIMNPKTAEELLTNEDSREILFMNNYDAAEFGVRLIHGPNPDDSEESNGTFITYPPLGYKHKVAVMFNEQPLAKDQANPGYALAQLQALVQLDLKNVNYMALEATYLSVTAPSIVLKVLQPSHRVIVYHLDGQPMPDLRMLRNIVQQIKARVRTTQLYLDRKIVDRLLSYVPNLDWTQIPSQTYRNQYLNPMAFYDHLAEGESFPYTHLTVWTKSSGHDLSDRNVNEEKKSLQVPMLLALIQLHKRRAVLLDFNQPETHHYTSYYYACIEEYPFVLLRVSPGPNYDNSCPPIVNVDQIVVVPGIKYIFGFSEKIGREMIYQTGQIDALVATMFQSKFKDNDIGVYLSVEFLVETPWRERYEALKTVPNWKYVIARVGDASGDNDWDAPQEKIRCMKYLLRDWNKETILDANWIVWERTYTYEDIPDPDVNPGPTSTIITPAEVDTISSVAPETTKNYTVTTRPVEFPTLASNVNKGRRMVELGGWKGAFLLCWALGIVICLKGSK